MLESATIDEWLDIISVGIITTAAVGFLIYRIVTKKSGCGCGSGACKGEKKTGECCGGR